MCHEYKKVEKHCSTIHHNVILLYESSCTLTVNYNHGYKIQMVGNIFFYLTFYRTTKYIIIVNLAVPCDALTMAVYHYIEGDTFIKF